MTRIIVPLILTLVGLLYVIRCSVLIRANEELKEKCIKDAKIIDSLNSTIWAKDLQISRYENALDIISDKRPELVNEALHLTE